VPYDWDQQVTLLRRELERARASLALEEFRNRNLPPLEPANTPEAWRALGEMRMRRLTDFLMHSGIVPDRDYFRDAMAQRVEKFAPPERRNFLPADDCPRTTGPVLPRLPLDRAGAD